MKKSCYLLKVSFLFIVLIAQASNAFDFCCSDIAVEIRAGAAPTFWTNRADLAAISCNATSLSLLPSPYVPLFKMPKFSAVFGVPWYLGAHIEYELIKDQYIFAELNYRQSKPRTFSISSLVIPTIDTISFAMTPTTHYRVVDAYVGLRNYWHSCWCENFDYFLGGKVGLVHHAKTNFSFTTASLVVPPPTPFVSTALPLFFSNTVPAIGANIGMVYEIGCNCSLVVTAEVVATCGPSANSNLVFDFLFTSIFINPVLAPNSFIIGEIGTEIVVPITLGLKYRF